MAHKKINVVGKKFGKLEVLEEISVSYLSPKDRRKSILKLKVKCECGDIFLAHKGNVLYGKTTKCQSCAARIARAFTLTNTGRVPQWPFVAKGKLTVLRLIPKHEMPDKNGSHFECKCACGHKFITSKNTLRSLKGYYCQKCKPVKRKKLSIKESTAIINFKKHLKAKDRKIGAMFGYLKILSFHEWEYKNNRRYPIYKCKCKCKKIVYIRGDHTTVIKSCGCFRKDNVKRGEDSPVAKLKNIEVKAMRELSESGIYSRQEIAKIYNISYKHACKLISSSNTQAPQSH